jgi:hypothetical protein
MFTFVQFRREMIALRFRDNGHLWPLKLKQVWCILQFEKSPHLNGAGWELCQKMLYSPIGEKTKRGIT